MRGLNIFRAKRISKKQMADILRKIEDRNLKIMGIYKVNNVIFKKRVVHFAEVGSRIERALVFQFQSLMVY